MHLCLLLVLCLGCQVDLADLQYLYCKAIIIIIIIIVRKWMHTEEPHRKWANACNVAHWAFAHSQSWLFTYSLVSIFMRQGALTITFCTVINSALCVRSSCCLASHSAITAFGHTRLLSDQHDPACTNHAVSLSLIHKPLLRGVWEWDQVFLRKMI